MLREQMGFGWPLAAVAASVLVLVAGGTFLYLSTRPPSEPFLATLPLDDVPPDGVAYGSTVDAPGSQALLVRADGPLRAFQADGEVQWCPQSRRLESPGMAWTSDGRLVYGEGESLQPLRSVVHDGFIYVDFFSPPLPRPPPAPAGDPPACAPPD